MKVLFAVPYVPSLIRVRPYNFIKRLVQRHEVTVLAIGSEKDGEAADALRRLGCTITVVPFRMIDALKSCAKAAVLGEPLQAAVCCSPSFERELCVLLTKERFDVVHIEHLRASRARSCIPDELPVLFDSVDCISLLLERTLRYSHSLRQRIMAAIELNRTRMYEGRILPHFDAVTVTSPEDARALETLAPGARVTLVPNGVDLEYFRPLPNPRDRATIVLSGKMSYHANATAALHFVRNIFPLVRKAEPEVRLHIVGSNPPGEVLALTRDPAISVTGYVENIRDAIGQATVAICPVTVKVGIQNKVLEAMAMGVPVVCSRQGVTGLDAVPGQDLLVAEQPVEFAESICRLLANPGLCNQLGEAGRIYVETHHRWDDACRRLEAAYLEAIAGQGQALFPKWAPMPLAR